MNIDSWKKNFITSIFGIVDTDGNISFQENDLYHKDGVPAIILINGTKKWYIHGKLHREDGPAMEFANGYKQWLVNDKRHREDGPAIEYSDGCKI
jgi:hypothetical protein